MKTLCCVVLVSLLPIHSLTQGNNCATAIDLILDGVCRTYNFTTTQEPSIANCAYPGNGRVIYFKFTTDVSLSCISVLNTLSYPANLEAVVYYPGCGTFLIPTYEIVCFNDGYGEWAMNNLSGYSPGVYQPNTTYYLKYRVEEFFSGTITICASVPNPGNSTCATAIPISTTGGWYSNSCNAPDLSVAPASVCAYTIENTAWFTYTTQGNSNDMLNLNGWDCDNWTSPGRYQVAAFIGSCGGLTSYGPCFNDSGAVIQLDLTGLPVGTVVHIAVDGDASSNCHFFVYNGSNPLPIKPKLPRKPPEKRPKIELNLVNQKYIQVQFNLPAGDDYELLLYDMQGRLYYRKQTQVMRGYQVKNFELPAMATGVYIVELANEEERIAKKIFISQLP